VEVSSVEIREAISVSVNTIVDTVKDAMDETPPEIIADLMDVGVCLSGGGGLLQGMDRRLTDELKIRVWVAEDPMSCVARGAGSVLEDYEHLSHLLTSLERTGDGRHGQYGS
jgi:rod shape-determining protein MreB